MKTKMEQIKALEAIESVYVEENRWLDPVCRSISRKVAKLVKSLPKPEWNAYWEEAEREDGIIKVGVVLANLGFWK